MILCARRAQLCSKIRLFCCVSLFLRNYLFRMRLFAAGPGGWVGALWEGWQVCGARFPFFCGAMGTPRPCKRVCGVCGGGCVFGGLHARQRDAVLPLQRGAGLLQICHSLFCPPCPAPDSRFPPCRFLFAPAPEVHLRATKIADLSQAQNPAAFTETDELFDVSDRSQLPAFNLSCVNCNPSRAILCGTYLIIRGCCPV